MKKTLSVTAMLLFIAISAAAQTVSVSKAMQTAMSIYQKDVTRAKGNAAPSTLSLAYKEADDNNTYFYVFNYPSGGYAIIGGDEVAKEVLGYCEEGVFDVNNIPEGMKDMLGNYRRQIAYGIEAVKRGEVNLTAKSRASRAGKQDIPKLVKTKWNQTAPYNSAIPSLGAGFPALYTGCNATAVAQIMKYYSYAVGKGSNSYSKTWNIVGGGSKTLTFSANFGSTTYDFGNMLDTYVSYTDEQAQAVGKLMYHAGVAMNMNYGTSSSSSFTTAPKEALSETFGYDATSIRNEFRDDYTATQWDNLLYNELAARHPIMYSGRTSDDGGHGFLIVGYKADNNTYAVNWGWGGHHDGYFALNGSDALNSGNGQYNNSQMATVGIKPGSIKVDIAFGIGSNKLVAGRTTSVSKPAYYTGNVTYSSSNKSVVTVDAYGQVTAVGNGTAQITVTGTAADCYKATTKKISVTVAPKPADYNDYLEVEEYQGTDDYTKRPLIWNNGSESVTITSILIIDKDDPDNSYALNISPAEITPGAGLYWSPTLASPIYHPMYEIHYTYRGNDCMIEYDPEPSYIPSAVVAPSVPETAVMGIYDASGRSIQELRPGLNIIRMADGKTVKVMK